MNKLLLTKGTVLTMEREGITHEACAVMGDRIAGVGNADAMRELLGAGTKEIDLTGGLLVPGFIDCHLHLVLSAFFKMNVDLAAVGSVKDLLSTVRQKAASLPPGKWLMGLRFREDNFPDKRMPTLEELTAAAPHNPVLLIRYDGHTGLANPAALEAAHITGDTPDPPGGIIAREGGRPTGVLKERAVDLVLSALPTPDVEEFKAGFALFMEDLLRFGVTAVHTVLQTGPNGPAGSLGPFEIPLLKLFEKEIPQRLYPLVAASSVDEATAALSEQFGAKKVDGVWRGGALKLFADGTFGSRTAYFSEEYADMPGERGMMVKEPGELFEIISAAQREGLQTAVHVIGDRAITEVAGMFLAAKRTIGGPDLRHRIEHCGMISPDDWGTIREAGIILSFQPSFIVSEGAWIESRVGKGRLGRVYPIRTAIDRMVPVSGGSDSPIETPDVMAGIWGAVTRHGFTADQRISAYEALSLYTSRAAWASFDEATTGTITKGKRADLVVLDRDPRAAPPDEIKDIRVMLTMIGGEIRYQR
jgi:predicted amidohydrolase YtcJ